MMSFTFLNTSHSIYNTFYNRRIVLLLLFFTINCLTLGCKKDNGKVLLQQKTSYQAENPLSLNVLMTNNATLHKDTLTIVSKIHNISGSDILILPSLLYVNISTQQNEDIFFLTSDALSVHFFGISDTLFHYWETIEGTIQYDPKYVMQFLLIENNSSTVIVYRFLIANLQNSILKKINYFSLSSFPAWLTKDSTIKKIGIRPLQSKYSEFNTFINYSDNTKLLSGNLINLSTQNSMQKVDITEKDFYKLRFSMIRCIDTTLRRYYPIKKQ